MYEIKEKRRMLPDGTEITTYTRDVVSANILEVEAGTTGFMGGDTGHGGRTYFRIQDEGSTDMKIGCHAKLPFHRLAFDHFRFGRDRDNTGRVLSHDFTLPSGSFVRF